MSILYYSLEDPHLPWKIKHQNGNRFYYDDFNNKWYTSQVYIELIHILEFE